jgi:hypothetical protein
MISAFGVEHGEIYKLDVKRGIKDIGDEKYASHGRYAAGTVFSGPHGLVAGKKGKKLKAAGHEFGGALAGNVILPGVGGYAGGLTGTHLAAKKGYYKKQKKRK